MTDVSHHLILSAVLYIHDRRVDRYVRCSPPNPVDVASVGTSRYLIGNQDGLLRKAKQRLPDLQEPSD